MVKYIVRAVFKLIIMLVDIVLAPLNLIITTMIPDLAYVISMVNGFFDYLGDYAAIGVSYLGFTSTVLSTLLLMFSLTISIPLAVHTIKLAVRWYNALKF